MPSVPEKSLRPMLTSARLEAALRVASWTFGVPAGAILRRGRLPAPCAARHAVWTALYDETRAGLHQIAEVTGGYDHTTILAAIRRARAWETRGDAEAARGLAAVRAAVREAREELAPVEREAQHAGA